MFLTIVLLLGLVYYSVRVYLENDAMIKARYLAKEYLEEKKISDSEEINKIISGFDYINNIGIKCVNYNLFFGIIVKILIFSIICIVRQEIWNANKKTGTKNFVILVTAAKITILDVEY